MPYIEDQLAQGTRLHAITRHLVGAFHGVPGRARSAAIWRRTACKPGAGVDVLRDAIALVEDAGGVGCGVNCRCRRRAAVPLTG